MRAKLHATKTADGNFSLFRCQSCWIVLTPNLNLPRPAHSQAVQCHPPMPPLMSMLASLLFFAAAPAVAEAPDPQRRSDQERAYDARRRGDLLPNKVIEARVLPQMKGYE